MPSARNKFQNIPEEGTYYLKLHFVYYLLCDNFL